VRQATYVGTFAAELEMSSQATASRLDKEPRDISREA
jgi:hypothetical protein